MPAGGFEKAAHKLIHDARAATSLYPVCVEMQCFGFQKKTNQNISFTLRCLVILLCDYKFNIVRLFSILSDLCDPEPNKKMDVCMIGIYNYANQLQLRFQSEERLRCDVKWVLFYSGVIYHTKTHLSVKVHTVLQI